MMLELPVLPPTYLWLRGVTELCSLATTPTSFSVEQSCDVIFLVLVSLEYFINFLANTGRRNVASFYNFLFTFYGNYVASFVANRVCGVKAALLK